MSLPGGLESSIGPRKESRGLELERIGEGPIIVSESEGSNSGVRSRALSKKLEMEGKLRPKKFAESCGKLRILNCVCTVIYRGNEVILSHLPQSFCFRILDSENEKRVEEGP